MKTVGLMLRLTRALLSPGKAEITDGCFSPLKVLLEMRERGFYGSALIKRGAIGLGEFMEMLLKINSVQNILLMWDVFVVNGTRQSLIFLF